MDDVSTSRSMVAAFSGICSWSGTMATGRTWFDRSEPRRKFGGFCNDYPTTPLAKRLHVDPACITDAARITSERASVHGEKDQNLWKWKSIRYFIIVCHT